MNSPRPISLVLFLLFQGPGEAHAGEIYTFINLICHDRPLGALCGSSAGGYCDIDWSGDVRTNTCQVWSEPHVGSYSWLVKSCTETNATRVTFPDTNNCTGPSRETFQPADRPLGKCVVAEPRSSCASSGGTSCMQVCTPMRCTKAIESVCGAQEKGSHACTSCCVAHSAKLEIAGCRPSDFTGFCYSP
jgi:hypothetical protein